MNDGRFDWTMAVLVWAEDEGRALHFVGMVGALPPLRDLIAVRDEHYPLAERALFERVDPITGEVSHHEWPLPPRRR